MLNIKRVRISQDKPWPEKLTSGEAYLKSIGETPDSMRRHEKRRLAAEFKRVRRIERNLRNEARQGNEPEGLTLMKDGSWTAVCSRCDYRYELLHDACEFDPDRNYCGRNEWCTP